MQLQQYKDGTESTPKIIVYLLSCKLVGAKSKQNTKYLSLTILYKLFQATILENKYNGISIRMNITKKKNLCDIITK